MVDVKSERPIEAGVDPVMCFEQPLKVNKDHSSTASYTGIPFVHDLLICLHMNTEFYSDYGTYEVELDLPKRFKGKVGGSGVKVNELEHGSDRVLVKFVAPAPVDQLREDATGRKPVVHDFAWTADPRYVVYTDKFEFRCTRSAAPEGRFEPGRDRAAIFRGEPAGLRGTRRSPPGAPACRGAAPGPRGRRGSRCRRKVRGRSPGTPA